MRRVFFVAMLAQSMIASAASAQLWEPATFSPAAPTQNDKTRSTFTVPGICVVTGATVVKGTTVRGNLVLGNCIIGPPFFTSEYTMTFGPLAPNTYTYEIYFDYQDGQPPVLRSQQTLVVSAAPAPPAVPTFSPAFLVLLLLSLVVASVTVSGRTTGFD